MKNTNEVQQKLDAIREQLNKMLNIPGKETDPLLQEGKRFINQLQILLDEEKTKK